MNTLMNLDPWSFLDEILDTGNRTFRNLKARAIGMFPPVNVYLDDDAAMIELELPGRTANDVELSLEPQAVIVAEKKAQTQEKSESAPSWSRRLELPFRVNADRANARFLNGILRIELPKAESAGVRKITIR